MRIDVNFAKAALPRLALIAAGIATTATWTGGEAAANPAYTLFESGQVRPLALSPNGKRLFAVNTPDNRLEIFEVTPSGLAHCGSVPVGLEPVAVAARSPTEVWVVNHLSDSVSVVKLNPGGCSGGVARTLLVGDEPRDVVFAGPNKARAFITTAHRGQNIPFDPQLTTPGVGRADVWVFDSHELGASLGGDPLTIITLFSDTPRALAVTPDGARVYAAAFHSGNRTTAIHESLVPNGGEAAGGVPGPNTNFEGIPAPEVGLILKYDGLHWRDVIGRPWDGQVKLSLPDKDVFVIDAMANPPGELAGSAGFYGGVGTILFNMAVNPVSGKVYVSNTEARNDLRFEGEGAFAGETLRGRLHESRITVLSPGSVAPRHLNKHIDYSAPLAAAPNPVSEKSLAQPVGMAVSQDGETLYVAAFGSSKIGVFDTAALENDTFAPSTADQIPLSGGGPTGLVLDEPRDRLYVLTRFDNAISIIDKSTKTEIGHIPMYSPEPEEIVEGRPFLYEARISSSNGEASCGSCHIFADLDGLAWDLGNPDGSVLNNPGPFDPLVTDMFGTDPLFGVPKDFHPMKGPMVTQSLRGMENHGPMHWRGDRTGGNDEPSAQPEDGTFDEDAAFKKFNGAFVSLLGRSEQLTEAEMQKFTDLVLQITYPPNPIRNLDNSLTPAQEAGSDFFHTDDLPHGSCEACHRVDASANPSEGAFSGFFGGDGRSGFSGESQVFKVPHLRNQYVKVGMFGAAQTTGSVPPDPFQGDQIRGFGFNHDGTIPTLFLFSSNFDQRPGIPAGIPVTPAGVQIKKDLEEFMLAMDSNMAPIVGQQVTLDAENELVVGPRIDLLMSRAELSECDLVAKGRIGSFEVGFLYLGSGNFAANHSSLPPIHDAVLRGLVTAYDATLTYTCVPPGSGERIGVDRDLDGFLDGDEIAAGSDPADPYDTP